MICWELRIDGRRRPSVVWTRLDAQPNLACENRALTVYRDPPTKIIMLFNCYAWLNYDDMSRSSPTGEGEFLFETNKADDIYDSVKAAAAAIARAKNKLQNIVSVSCIIFNHGLNVLFKSNWLFHTNTNGEKCRISREHSIPLGRVPIYPTTPERHGY